MAHSGKSSTVLSWDILFTFSSRQRGLQGGAHPPLAEVLRDHRTLNSAASVGEP
jgi:hypothetical protein